MLLENVCQYIRAKERAMRREGRSLEMAKNEYLNLLLSMDPKAAQAYQRHVKGELETAHEREEFLQQANMRNQKAKVKKSDVSATYDGPAAVQVKEWVSQSYDDHKKFDVDDEVDRRGLHVNDETNVEKRTDNEDDIDYGQPREKPSSRAQTSAGSVIHEDSMRTNESSQGPRADPDYEHKVYLDTKAGLNVVNDDDEKNVDDEGRSSNDEITYFDSPSSVKDAVSRIESKLLPAADDGAAVKSVSVIPRPARGTDSPSTHPDLKPSAIDRLSAKDVSPARLGATWSPASPKRKVGTDSPARLASTISDLNDVSKEIERQDERYRSSMDAGALPPTFPPLGDTEYKEGTDGVMRFESVDVDDVSPRRSPNSSSNKVIKRSIEDSLFKSNDPPEPASRREERDSLEYTKNTKASTMEGTVMSMDSLNVEDFDDAVDNPNPTPNPTEVLPQAKGDPKVWGSLGTPALRSSQADSFTSASSRGIVGSGNESFGNISAEIDQRYDSLQKAEIDPHMPSSADSMVSKKVGRQIAIQPKASPGGDGDAPDAVVRDSASAGYIEDFEKESVGTTPSKSSTSSPLRLRSVPEEDERTFGKNVPTILQLSPRENNTENTAHLSRASSLLSVASGTRSSRSVNEDPMPAARRDPFAVLDDDRDDMFERSSKFSESESMGIKEFREFDSMQAPSRAEHADVRSDVVSYLNKNTEATSGKFGMTAAAPTSTSHPSLHRMTSDEAGNSTDDDVLFATKKHGNCMT
jgi:hypothetical protein